MKTSEMIALLEKNPKLKFETVFLGTRRIFYLNDGYYRYDVYSNVDGKIIPSDLGGGGFNGNFNKDMYWTLIREPIPAWEAIKALTTQDKKVKWANGNYNVIYKPNTIVQNIPIGQLFNGWWYILEDPADE